MSTFKKITSGTDWTFDEIEHTYVEIEKIADEKYNLDYYQNQIEIISTEQMLDAYSSVGAPIMYDHWSFGKQFVKEHELYRKGQMGLAYEVVINSDPCIAYCMESNTMAMQALVIAHASFGHNHFFKNNNLFKQWTDAAYILDYLVFAKEYIRECEGRYGKREVEKVLDSAHALKNYGIDRYKRPPRLSREKEEQKKRAKHEYEQHQFDDIWRTIPQVQGKKEIETGRFPPEPQENILYFLEKHAPNLEPWKREIIRIVRIIAQYFYPQMLTQKMNEGFATMMHYHIIHDLYDRGLADEGFVLESMKSHSGVVYQRPFSANINPYAIGFAMYQDIKRIALNPTKEDEKWFGKDAEFVGSGDWVGAIKFAAANFKDESFIYQYLSPKVMRDFGMMYVLDDDDNPTMIVKAIQDDDGYRTVREKFAEQSNILNKIPSIQVENVNVWGDRCLHLIHHSTNRRRLHQSTTTKTLNHLCDLWGYEVRLKSINEKGEMIERYHIDPERKNFDKS